MCPACRETAGQTRAGLAPASSAAGDACIEWGQVCHMTPAGMCVEGTEFQAELCVWQGAPPCQGVWEAARRELRVSQSEVVAMARGSGGDRVPLPSLLGGPCGHVTCRDTQLAGATFMVSFRGLEWRPGQGWWPVAGKSAGMWWAGGSQACPVWTRAEPRRGRCELHAPA